MKIRYEFTNGEISEIEVDESLGELLVELDRQAYNNDHKETRRHTSLDGMEYEGALFAAPDDPAAEVLRREDAARLLRAMEEGYLAEAGRETLDGVDCLRLALDTTAPGGKVLCTVWLGGDGAPLYAEFSQDSRVVLTARLLSFTSE